MREFIIPDFYRPVPDVPWKCYQEEMHQVILEEGVRIIGMHASYDLSNFESVEIAHSVTDIRCGAFANCPKLVSAKIERKTFYINNWEETRMEPKDVLIIWSEAFANTSLVDICYCHGRYKL